jgi:putative DNA primase/helicase
MPKRLLTFSAKVVRTLIQPNPATAENAAEICIARQISDQIGPAVLLAIHEGEKRPRMKGWPELTLADMTPAYLAQLNDGSNIGVLLGEGSRGLCTVDADNDDFLESFLEANPLLRESLISKGARGANIWLRIRGAFPPAAQLKTSDGNSWGEWRASGNQTVIYGIHPSGCTYTNNGKVPMELDFEEIRWPENLVLPWVKPEPPKVAEREMSTAAPGWYSENDAGRAELFIDSYADILRYIHAWKSWLVWDGDRWRVDRTGSVQRLAIEFSQRKLTEAVQISGTDKAITNAREQAVRSALKLGDRVTISNFLELAHCDYRVSLDESELDSDLWTIGARNGVVDLRTGKVASYRRDQFITRSVGVGLDPSADCPRWKQFIAEIFEDAAVERFVWKAAGYSLAGVTTEHIFMFLYGTGANGKTTFCEVLQSAFGEYGMRASDSILRVSANGREPEGAIAEIFGKRLILGAETAEGARFNEKLIKDITGGDTLRGRRLYQDAFYFKPNATVWIYGNHRPEIRGNDDGIWRRVRLVPFTRQFTGDQRDPDLLVKLYAELPGILNWLVQGCLLWQREGLSPPSAVMEAVKQYRSDEDLLGDFLHEHVRQSAVENIGKGELFNCYREWAQREGIRYPFSSRGLTRKLRDRGYSDARTTGGSHVWRGVALRK